MKRIKALIAATGLLLAGDLLYARAPYPPEEGGCWAWIEYSDGSGEYDKYCWCSRVHESGVNQNCWMCQESGGLSGGTDTCHDLSGTYADCDDVAGTNRDEDNKQDKEEQSD